MKKSKYNLTPMMEQYLSIKNKLDSDTLLFFRLGDFYELFFKDAEEVSLKLGLILTHRNKFPMAGMPYHSADNYINKLLDLGKKVAVCEQIKSSVKVGNLFKRNIVRIFTPGTKIDSYQLKTSQNNYIVSISFFNREIQGAWLDISTGDLNISSHKNYDDFFSILYSINPQEFIFPESLKNFKKDYYQNFINQFNLTFENKLISYLNDTKYNPTIGENLLLKLLKVSTLESFGIKENHNALGSAAALIYYSTENLCQIPKNIFKIKEHKSKSYLIFDSVTLASLEIFNTKNNCKEGSLIEAIDSTVTPEGSRLLKRFLFTPTLNIIEIQRRQNLVSEFIKKIFLSKTLKDYLCKIPDVKRILTRIQNNFHNPRELLNIKNMLLLLPIIYKILVEFEGNHINELIKNFNLFTNLYSILDIALEKELPSSVKDGGIIKKGFNKKLDSLIAIVKFKKNWIIEFEKKEKIKTGIKNLKVKYHNVFGYLIEVTKSNLHRVPDYYVCKQTMINSERYCVEELSNKEKEILKTQEEALLFEESIYYELIKCVIEENNELIRISELLAEIDVFNGWAQIAKNWNYCCPSINDNEIIYIEKGRHPVIEQMIQKKTYGLAGTNMFIGNDTYLSSTLNQIYLITGPNMAGKSTYIRQVALITLMAQIGSWVPADKCEIGIVDRIFSRIGGDDELSKGKSTFMVEMSETANILNNFTNKSLIILDEIGRGTSTYDGLSIAWSIIEYLHSMNKGPKTLFATHYHELSYLKNSLPRLKNFYFLVKEWKNELLFMRKLISGSKDKSYGIKVAKMAGLPESIINRAELIFQKLNANKKSFLLENRNKKLLI